MENNGKQCWIGIDQSYHSTGVAIQFEDKDKVIFLQFTDSKVKHSMSVINCVYQRIWSNTDDFSRDEQNRVRSAHNLFVAIYHYLKMHCRNYDKWNVAIEGQVMSGFSSHQKFHLTDLVKLVSILEYNFMRLEQVKLNIYPPTSVKKYFTASGKAKKEQMIDEFKLRFGDTFEYEGKIDDVVDAYALCEMIAHPENAKKKPRRTTLRKQRQQK